MNSERSLLIWKYISLAALLNLGLFCLRVLSSPAETAIQYIPDDGFYYLTLARNYSDLGAWTFDSGLTLTSGFHPLLAYLLAGIYSLLHPGEWAFVQIGAGLTGLTALAAAIFLWRYAARQENTSLLAVCAMVFFSPSFLVNAVSITEWSLTLLLSLGYTGLVLSRPDSRQKNDLGTAFTLALLMSLARSDSGLWVFALFAVHQGAEIRAKGKSIHRLTASGLAGALTGAAAGLLHNYVMTGSYLQSSAMVKTYWAQFNDQIGYTLSYLFLRTVGVSGQEVSLPRLILLLFVIGTIALAVLSLLERRRNSNGAGEIAFDPQQSRMAAAALTALLGYTFFYFQNGAIQIWYSVNLIIPLMVLMQFLYRTLHQLLGGVKLKRLFSGFAAAWILATSIFNLLQAQQIDERHSQWPYQKYMMQAGIALKENPLPGRVGAWNAGIFSYFQGGDIVNLDGVVNNDVYAYVITNTLPEYLERTQIRYLIDQEVMFSYDLVRRGGYESAEFLDSLQGIGSFGDPDDVEGHIILVEIGGGE